MELSVSKVHVYNLLNKHTSRNMVTGPRNMTTIRQTEKTIDNLTYSMILFTGGLKLQGDLGVVSLNCYT